MVHKNLTKTIKVTALLALLSMNTAFASAPAQDDADSVTGRYVDPSVFPGPRDPEQFPTIAAITDQQTAIASMQDTARQAFLDAQQAINAATFASTQIPIQQASIDATQAAITAQQTAIDTRKVAIAAQDEASLLHLFPILDAAKTDSSLSSVEIDSFLHAATELEILTGKNHENIDYTLLFRNIGKILPTVYEAQKSQRDKEALKRTVGQLIERNNTFGISQLIEALHERL